MTEAMIPIAALGESQSWRDGSLWIHVKHERERLHARLTIEGHYGDEEDDDDTGDIVAEPVVTPPVVTTAPVIALAPVA